MTVVKEMFSRKRIAPLLLMIVLVIFWYAQKPARLMQVEGVTFGTIAYHIKYKDDENRDFKSSIDSLLNVFNKALSHYIPDSELSVFNRSSSPQTYLTPFLYPVLAESKRIHKLSDGAFNPAILPLVNVWGFGPDEAIRPDSAMIDSLRLFSDFNLVDFDFQKVWKEDSRVQLDFSASAKGYAVDVIGHFLESKGITNYFVEIGGEVFCKGTNKQDKPWVIGIISPESVLLNQFYYATASITDMGVATSANNFNYRIIDEVKYSHTIDPKTGYPANRTILSATIFAPECMTADAFATACMVLDIEKSIELIEHEKDIEALLIYSGENGEVKSYISSGAKGLINLTNEAI